MSTYSQFIILLIILSLSPSGGSVLVVPGVDDDGGMSLDKSQ